MLDVRNAGTDGKSSSSLLARPGGLGARIDEVAEVDPEERAFTFVDEHQCIGCYNCAMVRLMSHAPDFSLATSLRDSIAGDGRCEIAHERHRG